MKLLKTPRDLQANIDNFHNLHIKSNKLMMD